MRRPTRRPARKTPPVPEASPGRLERPARAEDPDFPCFVSPPGKSPRSWRSSSAPRCSSCRASCGGDGGGSAGSTAVVPARAADRARPRPAGRRAYADGGRQRLGDQDPGRGAARRCARQAARGQDLDQRRHRDAAARRGGAHRRSRPSASARSGCSQSLNQPIGGALSGATGHIARHRRHRAGRRPAHADRGRDHRQDPPRGDAVDRGAQPPPQRLRAPRRPTSSSRASTAC